MVELNSSRTPTPGGHTWANLILHELSLCLSGHHHSCSQKSKHNVILLGLISDSSFENVCEKVLASSM